MKDNIEKLKYSLLNNRPNLFLGAGFSLGAKHNGNSITIPSGKELKRNIITDILGYSIGSKEYNELDTQPLCKVCSFTVNEKGRDELYKYLYATFKNVKPEEYHRIYVRYPWNKIYSTNIDDIVENACVIEKIPLDVYNTKSSFYPKKDKGLLLYKLHGCVNNMKAGIIFDEAEYIGSILDRTDCRFGTLSVEFQTKDFVFVGSDFDDFNISYYLNLYSANTTDSGRGNLFFINPKPTLTFKNRIKAVGGILITYTAEEFADLLASIMADLVNTNPVKQLYDGYLRVKYLKDNIGSDEMHYDSYLYLGANPKWPDIFYEWDIILSDAIQSFTSALNSFENDNYQTLVYAIYGKGYCGKSVLIKRLANCLLAANYDVISYEGRDFDPNRIIKYIKQASNSKFALVVDDASYIYSQFEYICKNIHKKVSKKIKLCIVSSSRVYYHKKRKYSLAEINCVEYEMALKIDDVIAQKIVDKLDDKGYLGRVLLEYATRESRISYIKKYSDIASAIFAITYGKDFKRRFTVDVDNILKDGNYRDSLIKLAIFQRMQLPYCPRELFVQTYQGRTIGILERLENILRDNNHQRLELKNNFIGDVILRNSSEYEIINNLKEILINISSLVENTSNSYWNEIQSILMRDKMVRDVLKINPALFKDMLYGIKNYYSNNYNYWLQLGIAEQLSDDYEKALIHFNQAQTYGPNSYMVKNALGRNYILQAIEEKDDEMAISLFDKGKAILMDLIKNREEYQAKAYSIHTYVAGLMKFYKIKRHLKVPASAIKEADSFINTICTKYTDDPMFELLKRNFVQFTLQNSSKATYSLEVLQSKYQPRETGEIDFIYN